MPVATTTVNAELEQIKQNSEIKMALIDVGADLALVRTERLRRTLSVEHKRVRDQVDRA